MPPLTMRGRYLMREYWADKELFTRLDASEREILLGVWSLADDEGWLPRDVTAISASLFRYEEPKSREQRVRTALKRLRETHKVVSYPCGCLFVPSVARYPRSGRRTSEHRREHDEHHTPVSSDGSDHSKAFEGIRRHSNRQPNLTLPNLTLPNLRARAPAKDGAHGATFRERMAAAGIGADALEAPRGTDVADSNGKR